MNILITGASGFVGKTLLRKIASNPLFSNVEIVLLTGEKIDGYTCVLHKNYTFERSDFAKAGVDKIDVVIHLGAAAPRTRSEYLVEHGYKFMTHVRNTAERPRKVHFHQFGRYLQKRRGSDFRTNAADFRNALRGVENHVRTVFDRKGENGRLCFADFATGANLRRRGRGLFQNRFIVCPANRKRTANQNFRRRKRIQKSAFG